MLVFPRKRDIVEACETRFINHAAVEDAGEICAEVCDAYAGRIQARADDGSVATAVVAGFDFFRVSRWWRGRILHQLRASAYSVQLIDRQGASLGVRLHSKALG